MAIVGVQEKNQRRPAASGGENQTLMNSPESTPELHGSESLLRRAAFDGAHGVIVKVGTRVLTTAEGKLDRERIEVLAAQLCRLADTDRQVIVVSSGAVGAGVGKLGLHRRPGGVAQLQAVAAIGQADLIQAYESAFARHGRHAAQVLLTKSDLRRRSGYLHVRNALGGIHRYGAVAVVNENDSVAVAELKTTFGDNDRLAAHVAGLINDALLVMLSDVDGLYDGPPQDPSSRRVPLVRHLSDDVLALARDRLGGMSKGGMASKLKAARIANSHGHPAIIGPGRDRDVLDRIVRGESVGTLFVPRGNSIRGRRRWIGTTADVSGRLRMDAGATRAVCGDGRSLLAIGITAVEGGFKQGSVVVLEGPDGNEVARGLCNYPADELHRILGQPSDRIPDILGHRPYESVVHRDNMVVGPVTDD